MFTIKIKNGNIIEATDRKLVKTENQADILTFNVAYNSSVISSLIKYYTKIEVYNKNNSKIFDGRVIDIQKNISSYDQIPTISVTCESVLNFLNDTRTGKWAIQPPGYEETEETEDEQEITQTEKEKENDPFEVKESMTVSTYLQLLLNNHNSKVASDKKILLGDVDITGNVFCYNSRETTLNAIQDKLLNEKGGIIQIRESSGSYYLDYLTETNDTQGTIELGVNVLNYRKSDSLTGVYTRIIPIGADGLTIKSVNDNIEYVENTTLKATYGVIETTVKFNDVTDASTLKSKAQTMLTTINNYQNIYDIVVANISYISSNFTEFKLSQKCRIINDLFNDDEIQKIVKIELNLDDITESVISLSALHYSAVSTMVSNVQTQQNLQVDKEVTDEKISSRARKGEVCSLVEQYGDKFKISVNGKLVGKTYTFDGEGFTLGDTDEGDKAVHTNTYSKWIHSDSEYTMANADGFYRNGRPYHTLMAMGSAIVGGSAGAYPSTAVIQLPNEFKGKNFDVQVQMVDTAGGLADEVVKRTYLEVTNVNTTDGTFSVTGYWTAVNTTSNAENEKELHFSYIVVGG